MEPHAKIFMQRNNYPGQAIFRVLKGLACLKPFRDKIITLTSLTHAITFPLRDYYSLQLPHA